jgi:hypothetical protein
MRTGLVAEFASPDALLGAVRTLRKKGYADLDAFTPYPIHGMDEALGLARSRLTWLTLPCALFGLVGAYVLQWWCNGYDYPIDVGGRPPHSAPAFVPITFEMMVLCGGLGAMTLFFVLAKLPELYAPVFDVEGFERASVDAFFLGVSERDPMFDRVRAELELKELGALSVAFAGARSS